MSLPQNNTKKPKPYETKFIHSKEKIGGCQKQKLEDEWR